MAGRVVILMGSSSDLDHCRRIAGQIEALGVPSTMRVASAHKCVHHLLGLLQEYERIDEPLVYVAVAGRSNALAGMVDANTTRPVGTCPPLSSAFGGADIYSSLRMPSGVAPAVVLEPESAALVAAKTLALSDEALRQRIAAFQTDMIESIGSADRELN